jgi:hypothetical protein
MSKSQANVQVSETLDESADSVVGAAALEAELAAARAELAELKAQNAAAGQATAHAKLGRSPHKNQTEVVSLRNFRLASTTGHVVVFAAGEPKLIPNAILAEAMEKGCVPSDSLDVGVLERIHGNSARSRVEFRGDLRESIIALFLQDFIAANNIKDFDAAGEVKHSVLSEALGFDVHHEEAQKIFRAVRSAERTGEDLVIHKDAAIVKQIIEAQNKTDLLELLPHTSLKPADVRGMQTRDLRKAMLATFAGYSNE